MRAQNVPAEQAQFDFSPMQIVIAGVFAVVKAFAMRPSYSGHFFAGASTTEDRPALLPACSAR